MREGSARARMSCEAESSALNLNARGVSGSIVIGLLGDFDIGNQGEAGDRRRQVALCNAWTCSGRSHCARRRESAREERRTLDFARVMSELREARR